LLRAVYKQTPENVNLPMAHASTYQLATRQKQAMRLSNGSPGNRQVPGGVVPKGYIKAGDDTYGPILSLNLN